jgi:hypothetical protein
MDISELQRVSGLKKEETNKISVSSVSVPGAGIEPARAKPTGF